MPIGVDAKPAETGETKANKDVEENREVNLSKVEENKDSKADPFDDKEGGNPDNSWVDEVVVDRADADDEEGADGDGDGGKDDAEHAENNYHFIVYPLIFQIKRLALSINPDTVSIAPVFTIVLQPRQLISLMIDLSRNRKGGALNLPRSSIQPS